MDALGPELVDTPNGALSVRRVGNGDPMVVIPGGPGFGCDYLIGPLTDPVAHGGDAGLEQRDSASYGA